MMSLPFAIATIVWFVSAGNEEADVVSRCLLITFTVGRYLFLNSICPLINQYLNGIYSCLSNVFICSHHYYIAEG